LTKAVPVDPNTKVFVRSLPEAGAPFCAEPGTEMGAWAATAATGESGTGPLLASPITGSGTTGASFALGDEVGEVGEVRGASSGARFTK
jgi:hypothetical protein